MKVAHLTSLHPACDIRIYHKECRGLANAGFDVSLVAKCTKDLRQEGIAIVAIPDRSSRLRRFFLSSYAVLKRAVESGAKVCHFHDPELIPVGILLRLRGRKVIYDVHEDLPRQILTKNWIHPLLRYPVSLFAALAEWVASRLFFSGVVAATPRIASRFPRAKTVLVQNFPFLGELGGSDMPPSEDREDLVVYVGGIAKIRGIEEALAAVEMVGERRECRLALAGPFETAELERGCRNHPAWNSTEYHSWLDREGVRDLLGRAKVGLVALHPTRAYMDSYPIKLFEYMSAGIPVIASDFPLWREIVEGAECGLLVDPLNPAKIAEAIEWILDHPEEAEAMGRNGRRAVEERYNWDCEKDKLLALYRKLGC